MNVTAALDSNSIVIGDQIQLNFNITQPKGVQYQGADFKQALDSVEQIELVEILDASFYSEGNQDKIKHTIKITSFEDGTHVIPSILFQSKGEGKTYRANSNVVYLKVDPVEMDSMEQLMPIKGIIKESINWRDRLSYVLIPLGFLLGLLMIYLLIKNAKKKDKKEVVEKKVIIPAHIIAFKKLEEVQQKEMWQKGEVKPYYSELSYIAREYLENRYKINALESVTHEIVPDLKEQDITEEQQKQLIQMLRTADMVKFAKVKPNEDSHRHVYKVVHDFIERTKQIAPTITEEETPEA